MCCFWKMEADEDLAGSYDPSRAGLPGTTGLVEMCHCPPAADLESSDPGGHPASNLPSGLKVCGTPEPPPSHVPAFLLQRFTKTFSTSLLHSKPAVYFSCRCTHRSPIMLLLHPSCLACSFSVSSTLRLLHSSPESSERRADYFTLGGGASSGSSLVTKYALPM